MNRLEIQQENTKILIEIAERIVNGKIFDWDKKEGVVHGLELANIRLGDPNDSRLNLLNRVCMCKAELERKAHVA